MSAPESEGSVSERGTDLLRRRRRCQFRRRKSARRIKERRRARPPSTELRTMGRIGVDDLSGTGVGEDEEAAGVEVTVEVAVVVVGVEVVEEVVVVVVVVDVVVEVEESVVVTVEGSAARRPGRVLRKETPRLAREPSSSSWRGESVAR